MVKDMCNVYCSGSPRFLSYQLLMQMLSDNMSCCSPKVFVSPLPPFTQMLMSVAMKGLGQGQTKKSNLAYFVHAQTLQMTCFP